MREDIQRVLVRALAMGVIDFSIIAGGRTQEEQDALYAQGRTKPGPIVTWTRKSKHLHRPGGALAVDIVPYPVDWSDLDRFHKLADVVKEAAKIEGVELDWGYDLWGKDYPHWQVKG